jgi:hypothetical protein
MEETVSVLICCRNRPLHLWACLDSLYRVTRHPSSFVLVDMASDDPLVDDVVAGFSRRGMFSAVIRAPRNDPQELWKTIWALVERGDPYLAYVEGDVVVEDRDPCWLGAFVELMEQNPKLAIVGPAIDKRDFVSYDLARRLEPDLDDERLASLIKLNSPERAQEVGEIGLSYPHNPPGRLLLVRSAALREAGAGTDVSLDRKFRASGYETGIASAVRHRHLSLLNLFDYPRYDVASRDAFMKSADAG